MEEELSQEESESSSDYTVINGAPETKVSGKVSRAATFKCSQCFNLIEFGRPIYMRNDFPYCSKDCRELGVSSVYRVLFGSSVDNDSGFVTRLLKHVGGSSTSMSSFEDNEEEDQSSRTNAGITSAARAKARSLFQSIMNSASRTSLGSSVIRTYSSSLLWGKDMTRNSSFNMIFAYLPEIVEDRTRDGSEHPQSASSSSSISGSKS